MKPYHFEDLKINEQGTVSVYLNKNNQNLTNSILLAEVF